MRLAPLLLVLFSCLPLHAAEGARPAIACLSTDKPVCRHGDVAWVRAVLVDAIDRSAISGRDPRFRIVDPRGQLVAAATATSIGGAAGCSWTVPADASTGQWRVEVEGGGGVLPAERRIQVRCAPLAVEVTATR